MFTLIITILISVGAFFLIKVAFKKKVEGNKASKYSIGLAFLFFLIIYYGSAFYGFKKPGIVFERSEYEAEVNLKIKEANKVYTLIGKVESDIVNSRGQNYRVYSLVYIKLHSGQKRHFTEHYDGDLQLGQFVTLSDDSGKKWSVKLIPFMPYYLWMNR